MVGLQSRLVDIVRFTRPQPALSAGGYSLPAHSRYGTIIPEGSKLGMC